MAKTLNYQNYHKLLLAEHRHLHQHHKQQEQQKSQKFKQKCGTKTFCMPGQHNQKSFFNLSKLNNKNIISSLCKSNQYKKNLLQQAENLKQHERLSEQDFHNKPHKNVTQFLQTTNKFPEQQKKFSPILHYTLLQEQYVSPLDQRNDFNKCMQLTSTYANNNEQFNSKHINSGTSNEPILFLGSYTSSMTPSKNSYSPTAAYCTYKSCGVLPYKMFAAFAEAATLQQNTKAPFNKIMHVSGGRRHTTDLRSICYIVLLAFAYWSIMIKAAVATNVKAPFNTKSEMNRPLQMEMSSNKTMTSSPLLVVRSHGHFHGYNNRSSNTNNYREQEHLPVSSVTSNILTNYQRRLLTRREAANVPDFEEDDSSYHDDFDEYELLIRNKSAKGKYIGSPCKNMTCEPSLMHVTCDKDTQFCSCEKNYPVQLGLTRGCGKPKKLGEQCFYDESCQYNDENSRCVQVRHNAMCQCANGYHSVSYTKPQRRVFCTQDLDELNSDLPTLLGVCVGIGVLAGLICMVLHLFSKTKYPRHRNFGDANLPPPIMYSSETGIPLTVQSGRPSSRSSIRSSGGSISSYGNRRSSTGGMNATSGSKGILVSTSRTGSRRPSLASIHSTSSSVRSYSMMRFEKEQQQKEIRQEMKLRLARLQQHQQQQHLSQFKPQIIIGDNPLSTQHGVVLARITMATPSPMTPNSMDELLPSVDENQEYPPKLQPTTETGQETVATINAIRNVDASNITNSKQVSLTTNTSATGGEGTGSPSTDAASTTLNMQIAVAYTGPCSSSTEAL